MAHVSGQWLRKAFSEVHFRLDTACAAHPGSFLCTGGFMETEAAAQESLGLGKLGTQAEKDRRLKKK